MKDMAWELRTQPFGKPQVVLCKNGAAQNIKDDMELRGISDWTQTRPETNSMPRTNRLA